MMFPSLFRGRLSRCVAIAFVLLIVSPVTAPFQTVTLAGILQGPNDGAGVLAATAAIPRVVSGPTDTVAAVLPPDSPELRLKLQSQSPTHVQDLVKASTEIRSAVLPPRALFGGESSGVLRI